MTFPRRSLAAVAVALVGLSLADNARAADEIFRAFRR